MLHVWNLFPWHFVTFCFSNAPTIPPQPCKNLFVILTLFSWISRISNELFFFFNTVQNTIYKIQYKNRWIERHLLYPIKKLQLLLLAQPVNLLKSCRKRCRDSECHRTYLIVILMILYLIFTFMPFVNRPSGLHFQKVCCLMPVWSTLLFHLFSLIYSVQEELQWLVL